MLVLWSFGASVFQELGREQFLAVYTSAAVTASLASHLWTVSPLHQPLLLPSPRCIVLSLHIESPALFSRCHLSIHHLRGYFRFLCENCVVLLRRF